MQIVCEKRGTSPLFSFCWRECHRASLSTTTGTEARHTPTRGGEEAVMEGGREVWRKEEGQRVSRKEGGAPSGPPCSCSGGEEECIKERMLISSSLGGGPTADHSLQGQTEVWPNKIQVPVFSLPNHQHQQCFAGGPEAFKTVGTTQQNVHKRHTNPDLLSQNNHNQDMTVPSTAAVSHRHIYYCSVPSTCWRSRVT